VTERRGVLELNSKPLPQMPDELKALFEETH
jgi:hypothetical protein